MKPGIKSMGLAVAALFLSVAAHAESGPQRNFYHGVNLPQAGFGEQHIPGVSGQDYSWPEAGDVKLYADMGSNILRVAFLWERMQPTLNQPLNRRELEKLDTLVTAASERRVTVILDVHNYGAYGKNLIGSDAVPVTAFVDLWTRLAQYYKDQPFVAFGLMNEPIKQNAEQWAHIAQEAVNAIRKTGAAQLILIPGTRYSSAEKWLSKDGQLSNAEALGSITDPGHNFVFEVHQYFDANSSGTHDTCVSENIGVDRLKVFTSWLRRTGNKGFLGEFGASHDPVCLEALQRTLKYLADTNDVWYGWTYWAAAAWFGDYMFNIYPPDPQRFPQVNILRGAMHGFGNQ